MADPFESPIDKIIREARERGDFDHLPGKGKPLAWEDETHIPADQRMAQRLLKSNGFTLDWIALGKELDGEYAALRDQLEVLRRAWSAGQIGLADWQAARRDFAAKARALNQRVVGYNLRVPHERFQRLPYPVEPAEPEE